MTLYVGLILISSVFVLIGFVAFGIFVLKNYLVNIEASLDVFTDEMIAKFGHVGDKMNIIVAYQDSMGRAVEKFNGDFNCRFDDDLAKKLNSIFNIGQKPDVLMEKVDPVTNKKTIVKEDIGW